MASIALNDGYATTVDDGDEAALRTHKWRILRSTDVHFYAACNVDGRLVLMHRLLVGATVGELVDHRNGDGLDNRRANLRVGTQSQNLANRRKFGGTSSYKGVSWNSREACWVAQIGGRRTKFLGYYATEVDAAIAYNAAAVSQWGEWARLNDVPYREPVRFRKSGSPRGPMSGDRLHEVRRRLMAGDGVAAIARDMHVTPAAVSAIKHGRSYPNVYGPDGWDEFRQRREK